MAQWWVIASTQYGQPPSYNYFQGTKAQADAIASRTVEVSGQPSVTGPFPTRSAAEASVAAGKANTPGVPGGYQQQPVNPLSAISSALSAFSALGQRNTWLRVLKGAAGIALIVIGVMRLTGAGRAAGRIAREAIR